MTDGKPALTVIVPVRNGEATIEKALRNIGASTFRDFELIVVDDASTDDTVKTVQREGSARLLANETCQGANHARNRGSEAARGEILFFTDADVEIREDTLDRIRGHFDNADKRRAVIGLYSLDHPNNGLCSRYKNAWIHYSYVTLPDRVDFLFTAVAAVARKDWEAVGGFPDCFQVRTGGGDLEMGYQLDADGVEIRLDKEIQVAHHHRYSLAGLLANDLGRAYGFTLLALSRDRGARRAATRGFANISVGFVVSTLLAAGVVLAAALTPYCPYAAYALAGHGAAYAALNAGFLSYVGRHLSPFTALAFAPILFLDHLVCGFGIFCGLIRRTFGQPRRGRDHCPESASGVGGAEGPTDRPDQRTTLNS